MSIKSFQKYAERAERALKPTEASLKLTFKGNLLDQKSREQEKIFMYMQIQYSINILRHAKFVKHLCLWTSRTDGYQKKLPQHLRSPLMELYSHIVTHLSY